MVAGLAKSRPDFPPIDVSDARHFVDHLVAVSSQVAIMELGHQVSY
jgi:hypothetical protein